MGDENRTKEQIEAEAQLLEKRIEESGLSVGAFAESVLRRESRTVRRWIARENPIPTMVVDFLEHPSPAPWPTARTQVETRPDAVTVMRAFSVNALRMLNERNLGPLSEWLAPGLIRKELEGLDVPEELLSETEGHAEQARVSLLRRPIDAAQALSAIQQLWERQAR